MVDEVVSALRLAASLLDCTLGGGGHAAALLAAGVPYLTGIDRDPGALAEATERLDAERRAGRFRPLEGDFTRLDTLAAVAGESFDGVLADLGVSSRQLDDDARGFSFRPGAPLDMRMTGQGASAADFLNNAPEHEIERVLADCGDEPRARRLAREIARRRERRPIRTSDDLVGAIRGALGARTGPGDFARLFQAVRIAVNDELAGLQRALPVLRDRLTAGGTLAVIAYHSGEDRLVKHSMRDWSTACHCPPRQPVCTCGGVALGTTLTRRPLTASPAEVARNGRARSARLRIWRRGAVAAAVDSRGTA